MRRRVTRILLLTVVTAALLELVLQLGHLGVWLLYPREHPAGAAEGEPIVLCVGDSYTFGMGSSGRRFSYPAQLEAILDRRLGPAWRVVNRGLPGRNSRQVLELLDADLAEFRPRLVCVLVGINDRWSLPEHLELDEIADAGAAAGAAAGADAFRWEWRTGKLLSIFWLLAAGDATEQPARAPPPEEGSRFVGPWLFEDGTPAHFRPDGTLRTGAGSLLWRLEGDRIRLFVPGGGQVLAAYEHFADRVELRPEGAPRFTLFRAPGEGAAPGTPPPAAPVAAPVASRDATESPWDALQRQDHARAESLFEVRLRLAEPGSEAETHAHAGLAEVYARAGRADELTRELAWLRRRHAEQPGPTTGLPLMHALEGAGEDAEARALALRLARAHPDCTEAWRCYAFLSFQAHDHDEARRASDRCVATEAGARSAPAWRQRSKIYAETDRIEALRSGILAYTLDGDASRARWMLGLRKEVADGVFARAVAELVSSPEQRAELERVWRTDTGAERERVTDTYASHLRQIVTRCQRAGAAVVLATYPHEAPFLANLRAIAGELDATLVEVHTAFADALAADAGARLFVADGHCNDAGYRLLAEVVARAALPRLERGQ